MQELLHTSVVQQDGFADNILILTVVEVHFQVVEGLIFAQLARHVESIYLSVLLALFWLAEIFKPVQRRDSCILFDRQLQVGSAGQPRPEMLGGPPVDPQPCDFIRAPPAPACLISGRRCDLLED